MVLGDITNTASTAASTARASSKEHSKEMEDGDNSCDINSCDSSRENSCERWCADAALAAAAALDAGRRVLEPVRRLAHSPHLVPRYKAVQFDL